MAASDSAGKGSRAEGFKCRLEDFAGFMTHPLVHPPPAAFAVTIASKPMQFAIGNSFHVLNLLFRLTI